MTDMEIGALVAWAVCSLAYVPIAVLVCRRERRRGFSEGLRVNVEAWMRFCNAMRGTDDDR